MPIGRPSSTTRTGARVPTSERGVADWGLGFGSITNPLSGSNSPWRMYIDEWEFVPELRWPANVHLYDIMRTDSQLAGLLTATMWGITQLRFVIDPNGCPATMVKEISEDLNLPILGQDGQPIRRMKRRFTHSKHVFQAMLAAIYGFYDFEQKVRVIDGKARLRKLAPRPPHTIRQINIAEDGGLVSVEQWSSRDDLRTGNLKGREIGVDRLVAFIFQQEGMSQTGRSLLRDCYKDWLIKDRDIRIESINHERAGGVPYAVAPMGANDDDVASLNTMMQKFRIGETAGAGLPYGTELKIAKGTGSDVGATIKRLDESMARRFLLQLANLAQGGQNVGSYALSENLEDFFLIGQRVIAQWYCDTMTEHVIEDLIDWNYGEDTELTPRLTWERNTEDSLGVDALATLVQNKIITVDEELENTIRYRYLLPKLKGPRPEPAPAPEPNPVADEEATPSPTSAGSSELGVLPPSHDPAPTRASWLQHVWPFSRRVPDVMASGPVLVTVPNVPLLEAGIEYNLSTGPTTFTPEDLADAVTAANEDPSIPAPRLKLGHVDPRYNDSRVYDATPSFGKATNLSLSENGMVIYGDYVGVPKWLADIMPTAYPNRSIEGFWNVESSAGKRWRFILSACSLLGVVWPGIIQLDDLPMLASYYGEEMPADVQIVEDAVAAAQSTGGDPMKTKASANLDDVRRAFYNDYVPEHASEGTLWWWVRAVLTDPNELVIEDDETGQLYKLPFESDAKGNVSFGDSEAVRIEYVPDDRESQKAAASHVAATLVIGRKVVASWSSRAASSPEPTGGRMDPKEIRKRLNLPEDASDEQVQEATRELAQAAGLSVADASDPNSPEQTGGVTPVATGTPEPSEDNGQPGDAPEATATLGNVQVPAGMVLIDEKTLETLKVGASAGLEAKQRTEQNERDTLVAAAIADGRIAPAGREHWLNLLKHDPTAKDTLASLKPGLVPVDERGHGESPDEGVHAAVEQETVSKWSSELFPEVRNRKQAEAAAAQGQASSRSRITRDAHYARR